MTHLRRLPRLPLSADPIYVEWPIKEGGVCAYAWTDEKGQPYLCTSALNRIGKTTGLPTWFRRSRLKSEMVLGFIDERPLVMNVEIRVLPVGLELVVRMPRDVKSARDFIERRFTPWGSAAPCFSLLISPTFEPPAAKEFPVK